MYTIFKNHILPYFSLIDSGKLALVVASLMGGYVLLINNSPCIEAQSTCQVGGTNEFTGNISLGGNTNHKGTFDASSMSADRTWTLPDSTGTLMIGASLTGNKVVSTNSAGEFTTNDFYPYQFLSTDANKYIKMNGTGTAIEASSLTVPLADISLTGGSANALLGIDSTNSSVEYKLLSTIPLEGFDTSNATVGQFLKAGASTGVWQNIDPTVDLSVGTGTPLQELRVNSGGTQLEYFTPTGGGDITKVANGNMVVNSTDSMMVIACWYGQATLDPTKEYTLHIDGANYSIGQAGSYANKFRAQTGDCTSGGGSAFSTSNDTMFTVSGRVANSRTNYVGEPYCWGISGISYNSSSAKASNIAGRLNFRAWRDTYGFNTDWTLTGISYNATNSPSGIQAGVGACMNPTTDAFNTITGIDFFLEGNGNTNRTWALYETNF